MEDPTFHQLFLTSVCIHFLTEFTTYKHLVGGGASAVPHSCLVDSRPDTLPAPNPAINSESSVTFTHPIFLPHQQPGRSRVHDPHDYLQFHSQVSFLPSDLR